MAERIAGIWVVASVTHRVKLVSQIFIIYITLSVASLLMLRTIAGYAYFKDDVQFLIYKQGYIHNQIWKVAFYIHVFSAVFALFAGFTQFSYSFLQEHRAAHRLLGRMYAWNILLVNVPTGMIMAVYANGGMLGKTAFIILDCLWFFYTYEAIRSARRRDFTRHKHFMIRSYALTFSAITLRSWKIILSHTFEIDPFHLYVLEAWLGFVPNLLLAEVIIRYRILSRLQNAIG